MPQYYATVDANGQVTGFYLDEVHGAEIPQGAIGITEAVWQAWIANTNGQRWNGTALVAFTPQQPTPPEPVAPASVTNFQARAVLRATYLPDGRSMETAVVEMLQAARDATAEMPEDDTNRLKADTAWLAWEQSNEFMRNGPLVNSIGTQLGLGPAAIDALFIAAANITA